MEEINIYQPSQLEGGLEGVAAVAKQAENALGSLDDKLLVLRLNFGKLRAAIERAFAPITSHVAVALNGLVRSLTDFANDAGSVIAALFGTVQKKAVVTAGKSGKALKRFLADFDEIERLSGSSGGGSAAQTVQWQTVSKPLTPELQKTVDQIRAILAPLREISFDRLKEALTTLKTAFSHLGTTVGEGLLWAWHNVLVPLAAWSIEEAAPVAVETLAAAFGLLKTALDLALQGFQAILPIAQPVFQWLGDMAVLTLETLKNNLLSLTEFLSGVFAGTWADAWEGIKGVFRGFVNGIIGLVNAMLSGLVGGINAAMGALSRVKVTVPDWIPGFGGKSFGITLPKLTVPQIPHLAQGAVLPAGKPFLAMVGDQRHGTNIEAPLATIQEAVAAVMGDYEAANLAGHEATVGVLREILEAVLGIDMGDAALGKAVNRYNTRLAIMRGDG